MRIMLELPEDIAQGLASRWKDLPRAALESLALEAYRSHALTAAQLRRLLGFQTRMQVDAFLKEHEVFDFTSADFEQDRETLRQLRAREAQHWAGSRHGCRRGETEAIALATEVHADVVLIDEQAGRQEAVLRGLKVAGTLSVLDEADQAGLVIFDDAIAKLRKTSFRVSQAVLSEIRQKRST
jgi:predicted nucleic acid-binding protein